MNQEELENLEGLEEACLGAALLSKHALSIFVETMAPAYFYFERHRALSKIIFEMFEKREAIDLITLRTRLIEKEEFGKIGGNEKLTALFSVTISSMNIKTYVLEIKEKYKRRELAKTLSNTFQDTEKNEQTVEEIIQGMSEKISMFDESESKVIKIGQNLGIDELSKGDYIKTGFKDIDKYLHGMFRGELIILAARPSKGKSALAVNIAQNVSVDKNVLIYALEMDWQSIAVRILSGEIELPYMAIRTGRLTEIDKERIEKAAKKIERLNLWINDRSAISIEKIVHSSTTFKMQNGLDFVVVDYLQLMSGKNKRNRNEDLGEITRSLKVLSRDLDIPILLLSQLSREVDKRDNQAPRLSDLRDSGEIEQNADVVIFLYEEDECTNVLVAKNRNGRLGSFRIIFEKRYFKFRDL